MLAGGQWMGLEYLPDLSKRRNALITTLVLQLQASSYERWPQRQYTPVSSKNQFRIAQPLT